MSDRRAVPGGGSRRRARAQPAEHEEDDPGHDEDREDGGEVRRGERVRRRVEGDVRLHGAVPRGDVDGRVPARRVERREAGEDPAEDDRAEPEPHDHHAAGEPAPLGEPLRHRRHRRDVRDAVAEPAQHPVGHQQPAVAVTRRPQPASRFPIPHRPRRPGSPPAGPRDPASAHRRWPRSRARRSPRRTPSRPAGCSSGRPPRAGARRGSTSRRCQAQHHQGARQRDEPSIGRPGDLCVSHGSRRAGRRASPLPKVARRVVLVRFPGAVGARAHARRQPERNYPGRWFTSAAVEAAAAARSLHHVHPIGRGTPGEKEVVARLGLEVRAPGLEEVREEVLAGRHHRIALVVDLVDTHLVDAPLGDDEALLGEARRSLRHVRQAARPVGDRRRLHRAREGVELTHRREPEVEPRAAAPGDRPQAARRGQVRRTKPRPETLDGTPSAPMSVVTAGVEAPVTSWLIWSTGHCV